MRLHERASLAIQVIILALSAWLGLEAWLDHREQLAMQAFSTAAAQRITELAARANPELHARSALLPLLRGRAGATTPAAKLHERSVLSGIPATIYRYDATGARIDHAPSGAANLWLMDRIARGLLARTPGQIEEIRRQIDRKLPFLIGEGRDLPWLRNERDRLIEVFGPNGPGYLAWNADARGVRLLHCATLPTDVDLLDRLLRRPTAGGPVLAGLGRNGEPEMWQRGRLLDPLATRAARALAETRSMSGMFGSFWWEFLETSTGRTVYGAFEPPATTTDVWRPLLRGIGSLLLAAALFVLTRSGRTAAIRLRFLLILLFLASASIPLFSILIGSIDVVTRYQEVLGTRVKGAQDEAIRNLVQEFDGYLASSTVTMRPYLERAANVRAPADGDRLLRELRRLHLADWLQLRDAAGRLLYSSTPPGPTDQETLMVSIARRAVERFQPDRLNEHPYKGNAFTDPMVRRDDMGFSTLINGHRQTQLVQSGMRRFVYYLATMPRGRGEAAYMETRLPLEIAVKTYLRRRGVQRQEFDGGWIRFYALDMRTGRWPVAPPRLFTAPLARMAAASWVTGQTTATRLQIDTRSGFATCIPTPRLADHCLIAFYADDRHLDRIRKLWRDILVTGAAFLLMVVLLGSGIASQLLQPLGQIEKAVQALALRNFDNRLSVVGNDEMARLSQTFNEMLAESRELHVARTVQEGLVPKRFPEVAGYSIAGRVYTASDLSGDCLDGFLLPDGRFVFLVGDITGHGVAAALLMAFSRAVTFHWSQSDRLTVRDFTDTLDLLLRRQREARRFMSAICGILDPATHEVEYIVGGHPYPVFVDTAGTPALIGSPSLPLGRGKKPQERLIHRLRLVPGTRLLIATDGFIEALDATDRPIGFDRLQEWAAITPAETADAWIDRLMARVDAISPPPRADDTTLLAIVRLPAQNGGIA